MSYIIVDNLAKNDSIGILINGVWTFKTAINCNQFKIPVKTGTKALVRVRNINILSFEIEVIAPSHVMVTRVIDHCYVNDCDFAKIKAKLKSS